MADSTYSPRLRTAVVLCGTGTAGAYQSGVLRALSDVGVKIDLMAAHGAGVATALCAAIAGGGRLWDPAGLWLSPAMARAYRWRRALRLGAWGLLAAGAVLLSPLVVMLVATAAYASSLVAGLVNLPNVSAWLVDAFRRLLASLFTPPIIPTIVPRAVVLAVLVVLGVLAVSAARAIRREPWRRVRGGFWWRLVGAPLSAAEPETTFVETLWELVCGASTAPRPDRREVSRRYADMLVENLGQPGFCEVLVAVHDLDARRDLVGTVLPADLRAAIAAAKRVPGPREAELVDLGVDHRDLVVDFLLGALRLPVASQPHTMEFPPESYWRGEAHRICDRPELPVRLIEEIASAGIEQVILVSPASPAGVPHGLRSKPLDLRGRMGETVRSIETAALQDAWRIAAPRFSGVFVIRPDHNPVGPFDFAGAYDEASDRRRSMAELLQQGHDDAYRQFIEPIVASGDRVEVL